MLISLRCSCGRALKLKEELAGKKVRCPQCQAVLTVRLPKPEVDPEDLALEVLAAEEPENELARRPSAKEAIQREVPEDRPAPRRPSPEAIAPRPVSRDDRKSKSRPKLRREDSRSGPSVSFEEGWFGSINAGVVGGLLMMLIAVVWLVVGLAAGWIFFYPVILFFIGIFAVLKGAFGGGD